MSEQCNNINCNHQPGGMLWCSHGPYGFNCAWPRGATGKTGLPKESPQGAVSSTGSEEIKTFWQWLTSRL